MRLIAPWRKVICPFCFERFHLLRAPRRLTAASAPVERDEHIQRYLTLGAPPDMGKVTEPKRGNFWQELLRRCVLLDDGDQTSRKICPNCHMYLPTKTANAELTSEVFAIIGARSSGKSNYFGVLLNLLERRYASEVGFNLFDQDTFSLTEMKPVSSRRLYRQRYYNQLFHEKGPRAVEQTQSAATNVDLRIPLIYRLQFPKRPLHWLTRPLSRVIAMDLVVFDTAGEDLDDPTTVDQFYRYLVQATGIIFVIDPFQYPGIRRQLPEQLRQRLPAIETEPADIVARVINLFEQRRGLRGGAKIPVPVAFTLSKSDMLQGLVYSGSSILRDSVHRGGLNVEDCEQVSAEVMSSIKSWDSPQLVHMAEAHFSKYCFFAVSALGSLPDETLRLTSLSPRRLADPLLWLLWKRGYLRGLPKS